MADSSIIERLRREGRMTFAAFMEAALYGPGGYYAQRPAIGGAGADYFTAPELHPVFGALLGRQVAEVWDALGRRPGFDVVEHGPGTGALCRDLLTWAAHEEPDFARAIRYRLVERSAPLRERQRETLAAAGLLDSRVVWSDDYHLTPQPPSLKGRGSSLTGPPFPLGKGAGGLGSQLTGCILANELLDAFPVHLVAMRQGRLLERYVVLEGERLALVEDEPSTPALGAYFEQLGLLPGEGCLAEVNLTALGWTESTAQSLARGALLVLDYGYQASELYAPGRRHGTLLCYRDHRLASDPLEHVGEQDITSHLDFTSLALAGERAGLVTASFVDQATFLTSLGLQNYLGLLDRALLGAIEHEANRRALLELVRRDGLGAVKVLLQTRGLPDFRPSRLAQSMGRAPTWLPRLSPDQMRLPGPLEVEGFGDLEAQWCDFWTGRDDHDA